MPDRHAADATASMGSVSLARRRELLDRTGRPKPVNQEDPVDADQRSQQPIRPADRGNYHLEGSRERVPESAARQCPVSMGNPWDAWRQAGNGSARPREINQPTNVDSFSATDAARRHQVIAW